MNAPGYNGEPGARPYDREHDERHGQERPEVFHCKDCGRAGREGYHSTPIAGGRIICDPCYRWRSARGLTFDPRSIAVLKRDVA